MTTYTYDEDCYSDLHKEAYGCRPRQWQWEAWEAMTPDEKEEEWKFLLATMKRRVAEDKARKEEAVKAFELRIASVIEAGAKDRETAIKWMFDAEEDEYIRFDPDYFCYQNGLPYGYFKGIDFLNNTVSHQ